MRGKSLYSRSFIPACSLFGGESLRRCRRPVLPLPEKVAFLSLLTLAGKGWADGAVRAPIAQLDRATDYESVGRVFEPPWAHQQKQELTKANRYVLFAFPRFAPQQPQTPTGSDLPNHVVFNLYLNLLSGPLQLVFSHATGTIFQFQ